MERIRYADDVPICHEIVTVPEDLIKPFSKEAVSAHLYQTLEKQGGYQIGDATEYISAAIANEEEARLLNCKKGEALITRRQVTKLADGRVLNTPEPLMWAKDLNLRLASSGEGPAFFALFAKIDIKQFLNL